jgi:hypothetical protein
MLLNRAVCIDNPEFDVPWFHTKYCEEIQSLGSIKKYIYYLLMLKYIINFSVHKNTSSFYLDVEKKLNQLINNKGYLKTNSFSPYGYKLDFEILLNTSEKSNNIFKNEKYDEIFLT